MKPLDQEEQMLMRVANKVAFAWRKRGIRSYSREDLVQEAYKIAKVSISKADPSRVTDLEGYLYTCAFNRCGDAITRHCCPTSTRSNGELSVMGRRVEAVAFDDFAKTQHERLALNSSALDHMVFIAQVRKRMDLIANELAEGASALEVCLGLKTVKDITADPARRQKLYQSVRKLKHRLQTDLGLYNMASEAPS